MIVQVDFDVKKPGLYFFLKRACKKDPLPISWKEIEKSPRNRENGAIYAPCWRENIKNAYDCVNLLSDKVGENSPVEIVLRTIIKE